MNRKNPPPPAPWESTLNQPRQHILSHIKCTVYNTGRERPARTFHVVKGLGRWSKACLFIADHETGTGFREPWPSSTSLGHWQWPLGLIPPRAPRRAVRSSDSRVHASSRRRASRAMDFGAAFRICDLSPVATRADGRGSRKGRSRIGTQPRPLRQRLRQL